MKTSFKLALASTILVANSAFAMNFDQVAIADWFAQATAGVHIDSVDDKLNGITRLLAVDDCESLNAVAGEKYIVAHLSSDDYTFFPALDDGTRIPVAADAISGINKKGLVAIVDAENDELCRFKQLPAQ